jgi:hypothetical protein
MSRKTTVFKRTVSWDRCQKFLQKCTELGLTKGCGWFLKYFGGSDDFIMQKVYLLRVMPVCIGFIMVSCLFLSVPTVLAHRQFMDKNKKLTLLSQCKLAFTGRNVLMALKIRRDIKKYIKTRRGAYSGLDLSIYVIKSPIQLVRQPL